MRTIDDLKRWRDKGFVLTPIVAGTKRPKTKDGKVSDDWSDEELLKSEKLGFWQKQSKVFTLDFDDKKYVAHKFLKLFPVTPEWTPSSVEFAVNTNACEVSTAEFAILDNAMFLSLYCIYIINSTNLSYLENQK